MSDNIPSILLSNGARIPQLGLGTWKSEPEKVGAVVKYALEEAGYRHIDCAAVYHNEPEIGSVFAEVFSGTKIKREDVFITSKLWNTKHAPKDVALACRQTLSDLHLDYLDLYLMHWGVAVPDDGDDIVDEHGVITSAKVPIRDTWEAMQELVKDGLVKAIGVANFTAPMIEDMLSYAVISPAVNQVELHPYLPQQRLVDFCKYRGIAVTAYSPLGTPGNMRDRKQDTPKLLEDSKVVEIAQRLSKTPSQVLLRWAIQRGVIAIPKSSSPEHLLENIAVFDFELTSEDMHKLGNLPTHYRFVEPYTWWKMPYFG